MTHLLLEDDTTCVPFCRACMAANLVAKLARIYEERDDTVMADGLYQVMEDVAGKTPLGRQLQAVLLGGLDAPR